MEFFNELEASNADAYITIVIITMNFNCYENFIKQIRFINDYIKFKETGYILPGENFFFGEK